MIRADGALRTLGAFPAGSGSEQRVEKLLRLIYVSDAARRLSQDELDRLEATCRRRNLDAGISGLLLLQGSHFFGLMEGPEAALLARMEVVITDPRHRGVRILLEQSGSERRFKNWRLFRLPGTLDGHRGSAPSLDFILSVARRFV